LASKFGKVRIRVHLGQVLEPQPLTGEARPESLGARIRHHAAGLLLEDLRIGQLAAVRHFEKLRVRRSSPEEERKARCQVLTAQPVRTAVTGVRRLLLPTVVERGVGQDRLEGHAHAFLEATLLRTHVVEDHQAFQVLGG
jgi:hypothetical protein